MWFFKQEKNALPPIGVGVYALFDRRGHTPQIIIGVTMVKDGQLEFVAADEKKAPLVHTFYLVAWKDIEI